MRIVVILLFLLITSCNETVKKKEPIRARFKQTYRAIQFIDSFYLVNKDSINKNNVIKKEVEGAATNRILPMIDKHGLYDDIPFSFITSDVIGGKIYANFVFDDTSHFIKVQCIVNPAQIKQLQENNRYKIKFKTYRFEDGVSFNETSIDLPTVNGYLISFQEN